MTLWLQNAKECRVTGASINYDSNHDVYWLSVGSIYGGRYCDHYKTVVSAKRDFGKKFSKGGKWDYQVPG